MKKRRGEDKEGDGRWETSYIIILITNHFRTMKICTYLFDTRGHTHKSLILNFLYHIYLFGACPLQSPKKKNMLGLLSYKD